MHTQRQRDNKTPTRDFDRPMDTVASASPAIPMSMTGRRPMTSTAVIISVYVVVKIPHT